MSIVSISVLVPLQILPNIHSVHMNPDIWPEPEVYRPERFLDDSGSIIKKDLLIPFLIGRIVLVYIMHTKRYNIHVLTIIYLLL